MGFIEVYLVEVNVEFRATTVRGSMGGIGGGGGGGGEVVSGSYSTILCILYEIFTDRGNSCSLNLFLLVWRRRHSFLM